MTHDREKQLENIFHQSVQSLHSALGSNDLMKLRTEIKSVLAAMGQKEMFVNMALVRPGGNAASGREEGVFAFVSSQDEETPEKEKADVMERELRQLTRVVDFNDRDSLAKEALKKEDALYGKLQGVPQYCSGETVFTYRVCSVADAVGGKQTWLEGNFKLTIAGKPKSPNLFERIVLIGQKLPATGDLSELWAFVFFNLTSSQELTEDLQGRIEKYRWLALYVIHLFQNWALANASVEALQRLKWKLVREGWKKVFERKVAGVNKKGELQEVMQEILRLDDEFSKRWILRELMRQEGCQEPLIRMLMPEGEESSLPQDEVMKHLVTVVPHLDKDKQHKLAHNLVQRIDHGLAKPWEWNLLQNLFAAGNADMQKYLSRAATDFAKRLPDLEEAAESAHRILECLLLTVHYKALAPRELATGLSHVWPVVKEKPHDRKRAFSLLRSVFGLLDREPRSAILACFQGLGTDSSKYIQILEEDDTFLRKLEDKQRPERHSPPLVAMFSQKGGVGKTVLSLLLGLTYPKKGSNPCVVECDFLGPTLGMIAPTGKQWGEISLSEYLDEHSVAPLSPEKDQQWFQRLGRFSLGSAWIVPAAPERFLQERMHRALVGNYRTHALTTAIGVLVENLEKTEYGPILFDAPPETKDVGQFLSTYLLVHRGVIVFVATTYLPSVCPLLELVGSMYPRGDNVLLINRVKALDRDYVDTRDNLIDSFVLCVAPQNRLTDSEALIEILLPRKYATISWAEGLERFLSISGEYAREGILDRLQPESVEEFTDLWQVIEAKEDERDHLLRRPDVGK